MEQVYRCASDTTDADLYSILMPWFTVRKVKVDVELVIIPFSPFPVFDRPGSLRQK